MATTLIVGRPAGPLITLSRMAGRDYSRAAEPVSTVHQSLGGYRAVDRSVRAPRTWSLPWSWISDSDRRDLAALFAGQYGRGPYVLFDPACQNHLTGQQASGTDMGSEASHFAVAGGESVESSTAQALLGNRSLRWRLPGTVTSGILQFTVPNLLGVPVPAAEPWTFHGWVLGGGADPAVSVAAALAWLRSDGSLLTTTVGAAVTTLTDAWQQVSVTRASPPPPGAVFMLPQLVVEASTVDGTDSGMGDAPLRSTWARPRGFGPQAGPVETILTDWFYGSTVDVYVDECQLKRSATVDAWMPGEGVPLVSATAMPETVPFIERRDLSITLVEVG